MLSQLNSMQALLYQVKNEAKPSEMVKKSNLLEQ
jgi:hypothetical protein